MSISYSLKLGTYTFPSTFHPSSDGSDSRAGIAEIPRRDGVIIGDSTLKEKQVQIKGMLRASTPDALRTAMDALLAAVNGGRQKLYLWADRYTWATKVSFSTDYDETSFKRYCFINIGFVCDTGCWEADAESTDTWSSPVSGSTHDVTAGGNMYTQPIFRLTVSGTGLLDVELQCGATVFTLTGDVTSGDIIEVDCREQTVEVASADYMSIFDEFFPRFEVGANTLTYTKNSGTPDIASIVSVWHDRWY
jgi:phage-related protein